jgi:predicted DNA-binding transcriptional regulator YafY
MSNIGYTKERIVLFTQYFLTVNKPISVAGLIDMFERYSGSKVKRQTIYSDLNAINMIAPLSCKTQGTPQKYWFMAKIE